MKTTIVTLLVGLGLVSVLIHQANAHANGVSNDKLIAIDILLQPDQTMISKANAANPRLRKNYPSHWAPLTRRPRHAAAALRASEGLGRGHCGCRKSLHRPIAHRFGAESGESRLCSLGGVAVTVFVVDRTPELMQLREKIIAAVEPFSVSNGTAAAFVGDDANSDTIGWVEHFVPDSNGPKYIPHVTLGVAHEDFVKGMKAEPFDAFTFKVAGAAVYHLGDFGTAAKELWQYQPAVK